MGSGAGVGVKEGGGRADKPAHIVVNPLTQAVVVEHMRCIQKSIVSVWGGFIAHLVGQTLTLCCCCCC